MAENPKNPAPPKPPLPALPYEVHKAQLDGKLTFYGEFRRGVAVEFAAKGGKLYHQSKCTVETANNGTVTVTEFLADDVDWKAWVPPFPKGTMVYCVVRGCEESSGVQVASGKMYVVD